MRKFLLLLMATAAATPALAADPNDGGRRGSFLGERVREARGEQRQEQQQSQADRPARAERPMRVERSGRADRPARVERPAGIEGVERVRTFEGRENGDMRRVERVERIREMREQREQAGQTVAAPAHSQSNEGFRNRLRDRVRRVDRSGDGVAVGSPSGTIAPRVVTPEQRDARNWRDGHRRYDGSWRDSWRRDNRYDWRRHRDRNRSLFRFGIYYDPFGWSYRPYSIGWPMRSSYWGDRYWLRDPWTYRLPPVYGPYRWVRYWDDAILVDLRTGRVVDVIHNFFW